MNYLLIFKIHVKVQFFFLPPAMLRQEQLQEGMWSFLTS